MIEQAPPAVTWIKVDKPHLDIIGLILKSIGATVILALCALALGALLGVTLIRRRRRERQAHAQLIRLGLPDPRPPLPPGPDARV
jgi:ABC-type amino acid transport system permease subunit